MMEIERRATPVGYCVNSFTVALCMGVAAWVLMACMLFSGDRQESPWPMALQTGLLYLAGPALINLASLLPVSASKPKHFTLFGIAALACMVACIPWPLRPIQGGTGIIMTLLTLWCWFSVIVHLHAFQDWRPATRWLQRVVLALLALAIGVGLALIAPLAPLLVCIVCGLLMGAAVLVHAFALWYLRRSEVQLSHGQHEDVWPYLARTQASPFIERQPTAWFGAAHDAIRNTADQIGDSFKTRMVRKMDACALLDYLGNHRYRFNDPMQLAREAMACCIRSVNHVPFDTALVHLEKFPALDGENTEKHALKAALEKRVCDVGHLGMQEVLTYLERVLAPSPRGPNPNLERFGHALQARMYELDKRAAVVFAMHEPLHAVNMMKSLQRDNGQFQEQLELPTLDGDEDMDVNRQCKEGPGACATF